MSQKPSGTSGRLPTGISGGSARPAADGLADNLSGSFPSSLSGSLSGSFAAVAGSTARTLDLTAQLRRKVEAP